jgi:murein DD-endopeptidase MepM/ murein hydrolase activator NlpD
MRSLLFLLLLSACSVIPPNLNTPNPPPFTQETQALTSQITLSPKVLETTIEPTLEPVARLDSPTPTVQPSILPIVPLCSPLKLHPLDELPKVIGDPYDPPRPGREERHHGIDFGYYHYDGRDSMLGEPVQSVLPGKVASSLDDLYPYGNMIIIETPADLLPPEVVIILGFQPGESLYVLYAHMNESPTLVIGDTVNTCQPIGEVGMTGNTELPHLHLETRLGPASSRFESMRFYDTRASIEEMETYEFWRTSGVFHHFDPMKLLSIPLDPSLPILGNP